MSDMPIVQLWTRERFGGPLSSCPVRRHSQGLLETRPDAGIPASEAKKNRLPVTTMSSASFVRKIDTSPNVAGSKCIAQHFEPRFTTFNMARNLASLLGRTPATADEYRALIGKPSRA
jgi:hypothetical protein